MHQHVEDFYGSRVEELSQMDKERYEMQCETKDECVSWIRLFRAFDVDHDGFIPTTDLKRAIRESSFSFGFNADEVEGMMRGIDRNGDRLIDFSEFCALMSIAKRLHMRRIIFGAAQFVLPRSKRTEPFSYLQRYKCFPPPLFMFAISIIQIGIYIFYCVDSGEGISVNGPVPTKSPLIFNPHEKTQIWRYFSYMFIHIGIYHLLFNVFTQLMLGLPLELVHQWRVIVVYCAGVACGSLLVSAVDPLVYLAGASGGVYALLAAHLGELIMNWSEMEFNWLRALVLFLLIGGDAGVAVYQRYYTDRVDKVSYVSHIGGFIAGVLLGIVVLRNFRKHRWERGVWWISLMTFILFVSVCVMMILAPQLIRF